MKSIKMLFLIYCLCSLVLPITASAADEGQGNGLPQGLKFGLEYGRHSTEKDMKGSFHAVPGVPPLLYYEDGGELNGPVWVLTGEYRFFPKWAFEASYALGSGNGNAYWDSPVGGSYEDSGTFDDDFRKWNLNLFYTPFNWQSKSGRLSYFDVGLGYYHFSLEYLTANWSGGGPGTWYASHTDEINGMQIGLRGNVALSKRFSLLGRIFWLPNFNFKETEYENLVGMNMPGVWGGTGSGDGWDLCFSINFEFIKDWGLEMGYKYLVLKVDDWNPDPSNTTDYRHDSIDLTSAGPFIKVNYTFDLSR